MRVCDPEALSKPVQDPANLVAQVQIDRRWWDTGAVYQLYVRSFADGNGDGSGDLAGVRARLPYIAELGFDAIWINPWYRSPMADGGYDVADYRAINPLFGLLAEAEALVAEAHALGLRVIADIVPNHASMEHPWFTEALASGPGSPARRRFHFRPGRAQSMPMALPVSGTFISSRPSSPIGTGRIQRCAPSSRTCLRIGSTAGLTASASTSP